MAKRLKKSKVIPNSDRNTVVKTVSLTLEVVEWLDSKAKAEAKASGAKPNFSGTLTRSLLREKLRDEAKVPA